MGDVPITDKFTFYPIRISKIYIIEFNVTK